MVLPRIVAHDLLTTRCGKDGDVWQGFVCDCGGMALPILGPAFGAFSQKFHSPTILLPHMIVMPLRKWGWG